MSKTLRDQIYNNLNLKETDDLLEIWQNGDPTEWNEGVFEIIAEILEERLGYVPPQSIKFQVRRILENAEDSLDKGEMEKAISYCELAIQKDPFSARAYNLRGQVYDEMGLLENAITNYQTAVRFDPKLEEAWENLAVVEKEIEEEFEESATKQHLDQALEYAYRGDHEGVLQECQTAMANMPRIAIAHNYLGLIQQTVDQLEPAIASYLTAVQMNPRFNNARENLANARIRLEEEQYFQMENLTSDEIQGMDETSTAIDNALSLEMLEDEGPVPGWYYLDAKELLLVGWAGHRNRPGRSGYDPLETDFELAHIQGVIIRKLVTFKFRTGNPVYLILMTYMGVIYSLPVLGVFELLQGNLIFLALMIIYIPYLIVGIALLINVVLSL